MLINTPYKLVNVDLSKIYNWYCFNKLLINFTKTKYMLFNDYKTTDINLHIKINNAVYKKVTQFKLLGVIIRNNLPWNAHINSLALKIARYIGLLSSEKYLLTRDTLLLLYKSLILSNLQCGILLKGSTYTIHLHPLVTL